MSRLDEICLTVKELEWLYKPKKKGCAEWLAEIQADADRPAGTYHTNIMQWTCSCPVYLISRFLTCKHIVRQVNQCLGNKPLTNLEFFAKLCHQHLPPFFQIEGIHFIQSAPETMVRAPRKVLHTLADINTHPSEAASGEAAAEGATREHSPNLVTCASSPEYCNTSGLEEGSSSAMEESESNKGGGKKGSQLEEEHGDSRNVHGSALTDADSTNDSHVSHCACAFTYPADKYLIGIYYFKREKILEEELGHNH
jgi:SWIM zinc finger